MFIMAIDTPRELLGKQPRSQPARRIGESLLSPLSTELLMGIPGVNGVGIGAGGKVLVYVSTPSVQARLPKVIEDRPIHVEVTGGIHAL
jgi:hypothetical protein